MRRGAGGARVSQEGCKSPLTSSVHHPAPSLALCGRPAWHHTPAIALPPRLDCRPLSAELIDYARRDVHHLLTIADRLGHELLAEQGLLAQQLQPAPTSTQPSVVEQGLAARHALDAAMKPHSLLWRAVHRSQAVTLSQYQPTPPAAAVDAAAMGLMRRAMAAAHEQHVRLTEQQLQRLETVADCIHALCVWRDAAARAADEGLQCLLPDAVLLQLAEAAARRAALDSSNLRGRQQDLAVQQLLDLLPPVGGQEEDGGPGSCGSYPRVLQEQAGQVGPPLPHAGAAVSPPPDPPHILICSSTEPCSQVAALLSEAALGQTPWVCAEVQQLLQEGGRTVHGSKASKVHDPVAFKQRLAQRFAAKGVVYENCCMYDQDGELLCHTDRKVGGLTCKSSCAGSLAQHR